MKKILCLLGAVALMLTSCSSDDKTSSEENVVLLPKTEKYTYATNPQENSIVTYSYDGNKIVSLTYNTGEKTVFTYTENLITKAVYTETYEGAMRIFTTTFTYDNGKLKSSFQVGSANSLNKRRTYTYNANGTISTVTVLINPTTQLETQDSSSTLTLDASGNIVKAEFNDLTTIIEYDTKNNPFRNVLGFTSLLDSDIFDKDFNSVNNIAKVTEKSGAVIEGTTTYTNSYNSDNYLIKSVSGNETYEYTY